MPDESPPKVHFVGPAESVPVFNCRVIVARDAAGKPLARAAELVDFTATGETEREALQKLVAAFKAKVGAHVAAGEEIPWKRPAEMPAVGEKEFLIAVHL